MDVASMSRAYCSSGRRPSRVDSTPKVSVWDDEVEFTYEMSRAEDKDHNESGSPSEYQEDHGPKVRHNGSRGPRTDGEVRRGQGGHEEPRCGDNSGNSDREGAVAGSATSPRTRNNGSSASISTSRRISRSSSSQTHAHNNGDGVPSVVTASFSGPFSPGGVSDSFFEHERKTPKSKMVIVEVRMFSPFPSRTIARGTNRHCFALQRI